MLIAEDVQQEMLAHLTLLYDDRAGDCLRRIVELADSMELQRASTPDGLWTERDVVLITYGDQISDESATPLQALNSFLCDTGLDRSINTVHLLPCFPYSSDDGFSVIDYQQVDPNLGTWADVSGLGQTFDLMFDQVVNHCSQQNQWFQNYLSGVSPYDHYFIETDPSLDLSGVTRPRSLPLLTEFETNRGAKHVWTTFSDDQVDLNYAEPDVLLEMLRVLLLYVKRGARIVRLDAIAYLWKEIGTSCIHLPETHAVVKLMRLLVDAVAPGTILLTETNVPHAENISYFGDGDEAQMVYQFSLPPLLLDAYLTGDASKLTAWLKTLDGLQPQTTFFNFTASHDGIGVRPLEGLVERQRLDSLVENTRRRNGKVGMKRNTDRSESPYELNTTWFSALATDEPMNVQVRRHLATQAVMVAMKGIPGIYFHSLIGTPNDVAGYERTGRARTLNRRKLQRHELDQLLSDAALPHAEVFAGYKSLLEKRVAQPAFHPDAEQTVVETDSKHVLGFTRSSVDEGQTILVLANTEGRRVDVPTSLLNSPSQFDLLSGQVIEQTSNGLSLDPYEVVWLTASN